MIEIYLLEQLDAFARYGTLSKASAELHLTQPSLTRSMQKLEELLGVPIFERSKNKLSLNENGLLAADYARRILNEEQHMIDHLRALERSKRTIAVGSVGPGPLMEFIPSLSALFPDMSIISENKSEDELISGLRNNQYQFIILSRPLEDDEFICEKYDSEQLYVSLPKSHRFAKKKKLSFRELNGESFLMLSEVGIWDKLVREEMPDSKFIIQNDYDALVQLIESSILPNFATDITIRTYESMNLPGRSIPGRVLIPITDDSATVIFYLISDKKIALKYKVRK
ncbi:LysR family transcriptional regulator [Butyrivibrio sp. WCD2001]|uniref:LysR family transcriptional regulator n=1 Tax=Butyrivibrio sp. WCD2001 TaxID=1280681 RepID=UPI0003F7D9B2|nr:LysR family transcriptional regulator [Butyrivibrio sp. WCD2001]